eukprot:2911899-Amphidinium_carterae.1
MTYSCCACAVHTHLHRTEQMDNPNSGRTASERVGINLKRYILVAIYLGNLIVTALVVLSQQFSQKSDLRFR